MGYFPTMTLDSREWSDGEEGEEGGENDIPDPFVVCRIKLYNILCVYLPELAQELENSEGLKDEDRLHMAVLFDDETFDCALQTRIVLSRKKSLPEYKPYGIIGESSTRVAEIRQETVMSALQFIREDLRSALICYLEDRRDHIIADVETELKRWDKRENVAEQVERICDEIRNLPYL